MSISLEEARRKLDILEELAYKPELILTNLFTEGISGTNFLYQVKVNDKYILEYLREHLLQLPVFADCKIVNNSCLFNIYVESIKADDSWRSKYIADDKIIKINADERIFKIINNDVEKYEYIMKAVYKNKNSELSDYWKRFENLSIRKRIQNAIDSLAAKKRISVRIRNFVFWIWYSKRKINEALGQEYERINNINKRATEEYIKNTTLQKHYLNYAPSHIQSIRDKQKAISTYLLNIGYIEDDDMSIY